MSRLLISVILVPLYLLLVRLTSGGALLGFRHAEQVWTIEYLVPAMVAILLAAMAWSSTPASRPMKVLRVMGIGLNLALSVLLAVTTVMLWGDHI